MKKILIILILVLSIVILASVGWYFFTREGETIAENGDSSILPPFGSGQNLPDSTTTDSATLFNEYGEPVVTENFDELGVPTANLFRITNAPVSGVVVINKGTSTPVARYVDRATGHIYDVNLRTAETTKITNQTMPKIYEAYFRSDGSMVVLRSLKEDSEVVENTSLTLTPPTNATNTLYTISSTMLRGDITNVAVGSGNTIFYALRDTSSIVSSTFSGTNSKTLLNSIFTNWRLNVGGNSLVVSTKASATSLGYAYTLNTTGGSLIKILGPLNGLVVNPNNSGTKILYSYVGSGITRMFVKNISNNNTYEVAPPTIAEKCVWGRKNVNVIFCGSPSNLIQSNEPDNWYKGRTSFNDQIWFFDTSTEISQILIDPDSDLGINLDVIDPKLSPNEDYLVFINKKDLSLWALKLE